MEKNFLRLSQTWLAVSGDLFRSIGSVLAECRSRCQQRLIWILGMNPGLLW